MNKGKQLDYSGKNIYIGLETLECLTLLVQLYVIKLICIMGKIIYDDEFKKTICTLIDSGKSVSDLSTEYKVSLASINRWKKQYSKDKNTGFSSEKVKIKALEKELKDIKLEKRYLKKGGKHLFQDRQVRYHFIKRHRIVNLCKNAA